MFAVPPRTAGVDAEVSMLILLFAIVCGLLGEGLEVARLRYAGVAMPGLGLCVTLALAYAAAGGIAALAASFWGGGRARRMKTAAALFAVFVIVPWANFAVLPAAGSLTSIAGTLGFVVLAVALGWVAASLPRVTAVATLVLAVVAHLPSAAHLETPGGGEAASAKGKPNLLLILVDTLRADHLGAYGYQRPTSPRMDDLARQGVRFERAIAQAPWTKPSVASLFTGRYVHDHGVIRNLDALGNDLPTLATLLDDAGYRTAAFSANPWITPEFRFSRGFDEFESGRAMGPQLTNLYRTVRRGESLLKRAGLRLPLSRWVFRWAGRSNSGNAERDEAQVAEVVEWLRRVEGETPFFLYVHMIGPHDPYDPPAEFARAFARSAAPAPRMPPPRVQTHFEKAKALEDPKLTRLIDQYDAAIAHADSLVGRILDQLAASGLAEDTIVILTSDHGEEFYEHGNWRHGNQLYDEVVRVPLLIRVPGGPRGAVREDPAMLIDLVPTVLGLLRIEAAAGELAGLAGRALFPAPEEAGQATLSEHWWFEGGTYVAQAVGRGGWKLKSARDEANGRQAEELYDLRRDRREERDLLAAKDYDEADLAALRHLLAGFGAAEVRVGAQGQDSLDGIDAATRDRLRALGYLGNGEED
jgi:arylsulfatase A-like enzyme